MPGQHHRRRAYTALQVLALGAGVLVCTVLAGAMTALLLWLLSVL